MSDTGGSRGRHRGAGITDLWWSKSAVPPAETHAEPQEAGLRGTAAAAAAAAAAEPGPQCPARGLGCAEVPFTASDDSAAQQQQQVLRDAPDAAGGGAGPGRRSPLPPPPPTTDISQSVADSASVACALLRQCAERLEEAAAAASSRAAAFEALAAASGQQVLCELEAQVLEERRALLVCGTGPEEQQQQQQQQQQGAEGGEGVLREVLPLPALCEAVVSPECGGGAAVVRSAEACLEAASGVGRQAHRESQLRCLALLRDAVASASSLLSRIDTEATGLLDAARLDAESGTLLALHAELRDAVARRSASHALGLWRMRQALLLRLRQDDPPDAVSPYIVRHGLCIGCLDGEAGEGFDVEACGPVLLDAVRSQDTALVELILQCGVDPNARSRSGTTCLHYAARCDAVRIAGALVRCGAGVDEQNRQGFTPLATAVLHWSHRVMRLLLEAGADTNIATRAGDTPLTLAALRQCTRVGQLLLRHGADAHHTTLHGGSVLTCAVFHGCTDLLQPLLDAGVDPNHADRNADTALTLACLRAETPTVRLLLDRGAQVHHTNARGNTPLINAVVQGRIQTVALLLERGADLRAINRKGNTAMDLSRSRELTRLLETHAQTRLGYVPQGSACPPEGGSPVSTMPTNEQPADEPADAASVEEGPPHNSNSPVGIVEAAPDPESRTEGG